MFSFGRPIVYQNGSIFTHHLLDFINFIGEVVNSPSGILYPDVLIHNILYMSLLAFWASCKTWSKEPWGKKKQSRVHLEWLEFWFSNLIFSSSVSSLMKLFSNFLFIEEKIMDQNGFWVMSGQVLSWSQLVVYNDKTYISSFQVVASSFLCCKCTPVFGSHQQSIFFSRDTPKAM